MEPYLRASGITVVRNNPGANAATAIRDSNAGNYDVHFSIHSNAAGVGKEGQLRGVDIYFSPYSAQSERLASITANNMKYIYPDPENVEILPTTSLGEVTQTRSPAILAETAYHDNWEDAEWIKQNLTPIAIAYSRARTDYFGLPFVEPSQITGGVVRTDGSNLNIRSFPALTAPVVGVIPNGASVTINGREGSWYVVTYGGLTGYSSADFIEAYQ
jgi:N-acetylmuramoyl-L-alanine amidase